MKHGANIYKYAKKLHCKADEILDFSSNINLYQPDAQLSSNHIERYAESSYKSLKKRLKKRYEIKKSQIALFNGATSAIYALLQHLQTKKVYLYTPLYGEYEKACRGKKVKKINRFKELYKKPKKNSLVIFVNPSTPEGKFYKLKKLFTLWKKQNCTIILDESFLEFEDLDSLRNEIENYKKLYIIQSLSKFYSCAGVRIGAIFSNKKNITKLHTQIPLWNLSTLDVNFLESRLQDKEFIQKSQKLHKKNKKKLYKILKKSQLFEKIYKSEANFFLTKSSYSTKIFQQLLEQKILTRDCASFDTLSHSYLRFGVKNSKMHEQLQKALCQISL